MRLSHWGAAGVCMAVALTSTASAGAKVLRVGTYHGVRRQYRTIHRPARPGPEWDHGLEGQ